jgi:hypothetical protein
MRARQHGGDSAAGPCVMRIAGAGGGANRRYPTKKTRLCAYGSHLFEKIHWHGPKGLTEDGNRNFKTAGLAILNEGGP